MVLSSAQFNDIAILLGVLLIISITLIVVLLYKYKRLEHHNLKVEQQLLLSQMNPHFVFNSLTAIQSYIFRNDPHQAGKYLASFAKLVRLVLENSRMELTTIDREVMTLKHYFELQALRFEDKFAYKLQVDERIALDEVAIPPMLAQPFIENSIEHGFIHMSEKGLIEVRFKLGNGAIVLEIEDNGIGIERAKLMQKASGKNYQSLAIQITRERIRKIKQSQKIAIELAITDLSSIDVLKHGTLIRLIIPMPR
jgi:sensor histidine kinase YesM